MNRDTLQLKVNKEFKAWVAEIEETLDRACHDTISENDQINRELILRYILQWMLEGCELSYENPS